MKNKILILLAIAAFALASCGDDDNGGGDNSGQGNPPSPPPVVCPSPSTGYLGIGEDCAYNTGKCGGYQDYKPTAGKYASFPYDIFRVGASSNYSGTTLSDTVNDIVMVYFGDKTVDNTEPGGEEDIAMVDSSDRTRLATRPLEQIHISNVIQGYTLNQSKKILGVKVNVDTEYLIAWLQMIGRDTLPSNVAQLQPASNIRLAPYSARDSVLLNKK